MCGCDSVVFCLEAFLLCDRDNRCDEIHVELYPFFTCVMFEAVGLKSRVLKKHLTFLSVYEINWVRGGNDLL